MGNLDEKKINGWIAGKKIQKISKLLKKSDIKDELKRLLISRSWDALQTLCQGYFEDVDLREEYKGILKEISGYDFDKAIFMLMKAISMHEMEISNSIKNFEKYVKKNFPIRKDLITSLLIELNQVPSSKIAILFNDYITPTDCADINVSNKNPDRFIDTHFSWGIFPNTFKYFYTLFFVPLVETLVELGSESDTIKVLFNGLEFVYGCTAFCYGNPMIAVPKCLDSSTQSVSIHIRFREFQQNVNTMKSIIQHRNEFLKTLLESYPDVECSIWDESLFFAHEKSQGFGDRVYLDLEWGPKPETAEEIFHKSLAIAKVRIPVKGKRWEFVRKQQ